MWPFQGPSSQKRPRRLPLSPFDKLNDHIYELYKPKGEPTLEIVFFHGLQVGHGADAYWSTWTSVDGSSQHVWPATWLAEEFRDAHIFSISYDSVLDLHNLAGNLMHAITWQPGIGQGCPRPVILVGHSFGGLVIKALCVKLAKIYRRDPHSETNKKFQRFLRNTAGILCYATPHRGIHRVGNLANYLLNGPSDGPLLAYVTLSAKLVRLDADFVFCEKEIQNNVAHRECWRIAPHLMGSSNIIRGFLFHPTGFSALHHVLTIMILPTDMARYRSQSIDEAYWGISLV